MSDDAVVKGQLVAQSDALQRVNFLQQAALAVAGVDEDLSRFYLQTMKKVAQKSVLRMEPSVKHQFCAACFSLLLPGVSSSVRIEPKRTSHAVISCLKCGYVRRFRPKR